MRLILAILAISSLAGCAGERYTRHEGGGWTEPAARLAVRAGVGHAWGYAGWCSPWTGPWAWYPSRYSAWNACGAFGYAGYWGSPWYGPYPYGWYLPPRSIEGPRAGSRARGLATSPGVAPVFPRYDDLAPQRRRDTGGGDHAFGMRRQWPSAPPAPAIRGLGGAGDRGTGLSGGVRSAQGGFGAGSSARGLGSAQPNSGFGSRSAERDSVRSREEER